MKRLDVVLVSPGGRQSVYQSLGGSLAAIEPPVWAGLMATFLRGEGITVEVVDADAENLTPDETADRVAALRPALTAVVVYGHQPSASTQNMPTSGEICRAIRRKDPELKILMVGGHVAALPDRTLQEEAVDFVCTGEGPVTMSELSKALNAGGRRDADLSRVRGLMFREGKTVRSTPAAPLVKDLERQMPEMAWELLPMDRYRAHNWHCLGFADRQPYAAFYTTLGCPYHCSFCCIQAPFKSGEKVMGYKDAVNTYRYWSPDAVVGQIGKLVKKYGVKHIKIADEMFVLNRAHVSGICDRLIDRNFGLNIWAYARVDTVQEGMAEKLKRAGFNWLAFGIEAASARVRNDVQKGFGQEQIFKTIREVREAGINVIGNFIFGLPEDDLGTMQETLDMALELNCEFVNFYSTMAYPGSPLYAEAVKEGWALPESWAGYSQHSEETLPLPTRHLSAGEVLAFRDKAFQEYFNSPRYLDMVTKKFGEAAADHIREMAAHRLVRKHVPKE